MMVSTIAWRESLNVALIGATQDARWMQMKRRYLGDAGL